MGRIIMQENPLKKKLAAGVPVLGMWSLMPSPMVVESLAWGGLDFVIIDMEHGTFDAVSVDACARACESAGASPLVRIPGLNPSAAQWALDSGAHGIVVPQVTGAQEASAAVGLAKFQPEGTRGYNPFVRASQYVGCRKGEASKLHNDFALTCVIVENKSSLDELDLICALPGLDVIYIGVFDLAIALGLNGDVGHKDIRDIVTKSVAKITAAGKTAGLMVRSQEEMRHAVSIGATFLLCGVDTHVLHDSAAQLVNSFAQATQEK